MSDSDATITDMLRLSSMGEVSAQGLCMARFPTDTCTHVHPRVYATCMYLGRTSVARNSFPFRFCYHTGYGASLIGEAAPYSIPLDPHSRLGGSATPAEPRVPTSDGKEAVELDPHSRLGYSYGLGLKQGYAAAETGSLRRVNEPATALNSHSRLGGDDSKPAGGAASITADATLDAHSRLGGGGQQGSDKAASSGSEPPAKPKAAAAKRGVKHTRQRIGLSELEERLQSADPTEQAECLFDA